MKTIAELEQDIIRITTRIHTEYPELSKYIGEFPQHFSENNPGDMRASSFKQYYNSLLEVLANYAETHDSEKVNMTNEPKNVKGYPHYPNSEDIYKQGQEEDDLNPEQIAKQKAPNEKPGTLNEKSFQDDKSGSDLDVPGSELDDQQERVGSEDEENNYYSLGGDAHNDLDEDKG